MIRRLPKLRGHWCKLAAIGGAAALALAAGWGGVAYAQQTPLVGGYSTSASGSSAQTPTTSSEPGFIKNLHITGFVQNTSATWVNSSAMEYNKDRWGKLNRNSLAAERNLLQIDVNDDFTENDSMFLRAWFVYEPNYPWETGCLNGNPFGAGPLASDSLHLGLLQRLRHP